MFLTVTISREAREVISNLASPGRHTRGSISSGGGGPDVRVGGPNPSGGDGNYHYLSRGPFVLALTLGLRTSSGWTGLHRADACTPLGSGSWPNRRASSVGAGEAMGSSSADSSKEASKKSSSSSCMRGTRHLCMSWTAPHIVPGGAPDHSVQHWKAFASTTVCSFHTSGMSLVPQNLHSGMRSHHLRLLRQGGVFNQPILSSWGASNLEPATHFFCQLLHLGIAELPCTNGPELQPPDWDLTFLS